MKVYIASSLLNAEKVQYLISKLSNNGCEITYDWTIHGKVDDEEMLREICKSEVQAVLDADVLLFLHPARTGSHVELGIMIAAKRLLGSKLIVILDEHGTAEPKSFYFEEGIVKFTQEQEAIEFISMIARDHYERANQIRNRRAPI